MHELGTLIKDRDMSVEMQNLQVHLHVLEMDVKSSFEAKSSGLAQTLMQNYGRGVGF